MAGSVTYFLKDGGVLKVIRPEQYGVGGPPRYTLNDVEISAEKAVKIIKDLGFGVK